MTYAQQTAADPFANSLAGRRLGRYEVLARLASGGMAGVYVARAIGVAGFERLFAIKVLHPHLAHEAEFISMFLDEARLAARIRHPNVVPTIDISDTQGAGFYLVMDYVEGDHLGALLRRASELRTRLPAPVALRIVVDALNGLAAAHGLTDEHNRRLNLVHRDVSPHNIMVGTDGVARLTDFGVAKAEFRLGATRDGQFKGKLAYMAPEHASDGVADQRSDLFAMGIILWESLTGQRLFRAENQAATLNKICIEPIPPPSAVDPGLAPMDGLLAQALARDPRKRFQTAEIFAEALERSAAALGGLANQRVVAKIVRAYASAKISRDDHLIRSAVMELSQARSRRARSDSGERLRFSPEEMDLESSPTLPSEPSAVNDFTATPAEADVDASAPRNRQALLLAGVAALSLSVVGMSYLLTRGDRPTARLVAGESTEPSPAAGDERPPQVQDTVEASPAADEVAAEAEEVEVEVHPSPRRPGAKSAPVRARPVAQSEPDTPPAGAPRTATRRATTQPTTPRGAGRVRAGTTAEPKERAIAPDREIQPGGLATRPPPVREPEPAEPEPTPRSELPEDPADDLLLNPYR